MVAVGGVLVSFGRAMRYFRRVEGNGMDRIFIGLLTLNANELHRCAPGVYMSRVFNTRWVYLLAPILQATSIRIATHSQYVYLNPSVPSSTLFPLLCLAFAI